MRTLILAIFLMSLTTSTWAASKNKPIPAVPGEWVIKLKNNPALKNTQALTSIAQDLQIHLGNKSAVTVRTLMTTTEFAVIKVKGSDVEKALGLLKQDSRIAYAEPNFIYHTSQASVPSDEKFQQLWGLSNQGQVIESVQGKVNADIHMMQAWGLGAYGSSSIKVAVIDTGIDLTHPDLQQNIWTNTAEVAGNGVDDDGDGFIDDVHGWNFVNNTNNPNDDQNHGSHCSGVIGAKGNNGIGVTGVNWNVTLVPVKFLDSNGSGTLEAAVQSIQYATKVGVNIMSNSWGGGGYSQALYDAIADARNHGILFIAAAGNAASNNDEVASYPASYDLDNIISVAATDNRDRIADFSNYGHTKVHVAAPGVDIYSTAKNGGYMLMSGTSMATPHVSGVAALMLSQNPSLSYAQVKDILIRSSDPVHGLGKKVISGGRINAFNALQGIFPVSQSPDETKWQNVSYSVESPHPYESSKVYTFPITVPDAKFVRVIFEDIDTELTYDTITVTDSAQDEVEKLSGAVSNYVTDYLVGPSVNVVLTTDSSIVKTGFKISKVQAIY